MNASPADPFARRDSYHVRDSQTASVERAADRINRDISLQVVARGTNLGIGLLSLIVLVHALGPTKFGEWATALAVMQLCLYATDLGFEKWAIAAAIKSPEKAEEWLSALRVAGLILGVVMCVVCMTAISLIARNSTMRLTGYILACVLLLTPLIRSTAIYQLKMRNGVPVLCQTVFSIVWLAAAISLSLIHASLESFALAYLAARAIGSALQAFLARDLMKFRSTGSLLLAKRLLRDGMTLALANAVVVAYGRIDQVIVYVVLGPVDAGIYATLYQLIVAAGVFPQSITTSAFPHLARAASLSTDYLRNVMGACARLLAAVGGLPPILAAGLAATILPAVFGPKYEDAAPAMAVLCVSYQVVCFGYLSGQMLVISKLGKQYSIAAVIALLVNVALNLVLLPEFGYTGAAWATLLTEILAVGIAWRLTLDSIGSPLDWRPPLMIALSAIIVSTPIAYVHAAGASISLTIAATVVALTAFLALSKSQVGRNALADVI